MRSNRAGRTSEINSLQIKICKEFFFSQRGFKNQALSMSQLPFFPQNSVNSLPNTLEKYL